MVVGERVSERQHIVPAPRQRPATRSPGSPSHLHVGKVDGRIDAQQQQAGLVLRGGVHALAAVNVGAGEAAQGADAREGALVDDHHQAEAHSHANAHLHALGGGGVG